MLRYKAINCKIIDNFRDNPDLGKIIKDALDKGQVVQAVANE